MSAFRTIRPQRRMPRPHVAITSLVTGIILSVFGASAAFAGPAPVDEGRGTGGGGGAPIPSGSESGFDWTPWLISAAALLVLVVAAAMIAATVRRHSPAHV